VSTGCGFAHIDGDFCNFLAAWLACGLVEKVDLVCRNKGRFSIDN